MQQINNLFPADESFNVESEALKKHTNPAAEGKFHSHEASLHGRIASSRTNAIRSQRQGQVSRPTPSAAPGGMRDSWAAYNAQRAKLGQRSVKTTNNPYNNQKIKG